MSIETEQQPVAVHDYEQVREIRLNQPKAHNSLTVTMAQALLTDLDEAAQQQDIRAVLISAEGVSFCAGGDLREMQAHQDDLAGYVDQAMRDVHNPLIARIANFPKPIVTAVQGPAVGAGAGLALASDLTILAESANLVLPFLDKLAIVPDAGCSWVLPNTIGKQRAMGHLLTGQAIGAQRAVDYGLVWQCVPDAQLRETSLRLARQAASLSGAAVVRTRQLLNAAVSQDLEAQLEAERAMQRESFAAPDVREGISALLERRAPQFTS